jgi:drug/metabolite transporter (DMT)-like permease
VTDRTKGLLAVLVTVVLWASAFVAIRHVGHEISAGPLALGRLVIGALVLGAVLFARRGSGATGAVAAYRQPGVWARLVTIGVLWFGVYNVALNAAERRIDAGTASMLVNVGPIIIAVLAGIVLREGFPLPLVVGTVIAFAGVVVIGLSTSHTAGADLLGVLLCLLAAVVYAVSVVVQKPLLTRLSGLQVTWAACTIGAICCLPFAPALARETSHASAGAIGWTVYLGVMPTALAFTTWAYALARTDAGKLGVTTYLVPPIAILLGWALLGETPAGLAYVGGAICLAGVYVSRLKRSVPEPVKVASGHQAE